MRLGLMLGSDRDRPYRERLDAWLDHARAADAAGYASMWITQIPGYLDALTAIALMGDVTQQIELATSVVPIQTRHPVAMAQQVLTAQIACDGRVTLGIGPSHHWVVEEQLGLPYERPAHLVRAYLEVLSAALAGPGAVDVENDVYRVHSPMNVTDIVPTPILLAALGPVMLRLAGAHTSGTILWMADERAIAEYIAPRITSAAAEAGRPAPRIVAGVPVALCSGRELETVRETANDVLGHADFSPNYLRLLEHGDAEDVGDVVAAGDESAIVERLQRFRDAGVTDLAARVLPLGDDPDARRASQQRTRAFLDSLVPELS
jgi:F420-dependent oxidoreductase-like protein